MDVSTTRLKNLTDLQAEHGLSRKDLAVRLGMETGQLNHLFMDPERDGRRNIGTKIARRIEEAFEKPRGWLDQRHRERGGGRQRHHRRACPREGRMVLERAAPLAAIITALTACALGYGERMTEALRSYHGKNVTTFTAVMGPPRSSSEIAGERWHTWRYESYGGGTLPLECTIHLKVSPDDRILAHRWGGNNGACLELSQRL